MTNATKPAAKFVPMYYVVSTMLAQQMRGERVNSKKGTFYGVFATPDAASSFVSERKLTLCSEIVVQ